MKILLFVALLAVLATAVHAWTKEDHEIFDLVSALEGAEGKGTTFYSWLDVPSTATTPEIARAYRKKSVQLHPDKNPGVKGIHQRFARLGVISTILRNAESRKRYDFFYKNGVPTWRGTGYYYSRFRPGLGTVFVFLTLLSSALQYIIQRLNYKRDLKRVDHIVREAKMAAWGQKMTPVEGRRKVKVNLGGPPRLDEEGNVILGKSIDMVVESNGDVHIFDDGHLIPVNATTAIRPTVQNTWFLSLMASLFRSAMKRSTSTSKADEMQAPESEGTETATDSDMPELEDSDVPNGNGNGAGSATMKGGKAAAASMKAGGRRRKAVRKR